MNSWLTFLIGHILEFTNIYPAWLRFECHGASGILQKVLVGFDCLASIPRRRALKKIATWQKRQKPHLWFFFFFHTNLLPCGVYWFPKAKCLDWLHQSHFGSLLKLLIPWPNLDLQNQPFCGWSVGSDLWTMAPGWFWCPAKFGQHWQMPSDNETFG